MCTFVQFIGDIGYKSMIDRDRHVLKLFKGNAKIFKENMNFIVGNLLSFAKSDETIHPPPAVSSSLA
jgi:hypothetical protein